MKKTKEMEDENVRLKDENAKLEDDKARLEKECKELKNCGICLEEQKQILLLPCHHIYLCQKCFDNCHCKCPICREKITDHAKVFIS